MHEPLVEALPGILGAASAMGGLGGMAAIAGARLRRKRPPTQELDDHPTDQPSDDDLTSVSPQ